MYLALHRAHSRQDRSGGGRRPNGTTRTHNKRRPDLVLKRADPLRDACGRQVKMSCGFCNGSAFDNCDKTVKEASVHRNKMYLVKMQKSIFTIVV
jgi:hypothetical protein